MTISRSTQAADDRRAGRSLIAGIDRGSAIRADQASAAKETVVYLGKDANMPDPALSRNDLPGHRDRQWLPGQGRRSR